MNADITQKMVNHLRNMLMLDSLPKVKDQLVRKKIINQFFANAQKKQAVPQLFAIGGGPASGKSLFYENLKAKGQLPLNSVIHDPDLVMQSIPQYQIDASCNPEIAFKNWELLALQLANEILLKAFIAKYNIVYMRTFALPDSLKFVQYAKLYGYKVDIHILSCDYNIAISRALERQKRTKRHLPVEKLLERHDEVAKLLPNIIEISDNYFFYENNKNGDEPILLQKI